MRAFVFLFVLGIAAMSAAPIVAADLPEPDQLPAISEFPDPLTTRSGKKIQTTEQWFAERRPELSALFQHYMYGTLPAIKTSVSGKIAHEDRNAFDGKATLR